MGQKVNPKSFRIGIIDLWDSRWFAHGKQYAQLFHNDLALKEAIHEKLKNCSITKVEIERFAKKVVINIYSGKPGMLIGRQGLGVDDLRNLLHRRFGQNYEVNVLEVQNPDLSAQLIGELVGTQIEKRIAYRRAVKMSIQKVVEAGAKGVKIQVSGRLNGVEISRREYFKDGNIPLHTLRADIDFAKVNAYTTYGVIGIKVWIYKGMVFGRRGEFFSSSSIQEKESAKKMEAMKDRLKA